MPRTRARHAELSEACSCGVCPSGSRRDRGTTLVEILISIVLLGLVVGATLTTLSVTINASATDRDHANAHAWLQTAADVLYARELAPCDLNAGTQAEVDAGTATKTTGEDIADITAAYESTIQATENPEGWGAANIEIYDLQFWHVDMDPATKLTVEGWGSQCDSGDTNLQRIGISVRSDSGEIVEQVEVIIGE